MHLYDPSQDELELVVAHGLPSVLGTRAKLGEGLAGRAAQNREPIIVDDYQTWERRSLAFAQIPFRAILEVPMLHRGELIGVLAVHELGDSTRKFTEEDARLLSLFAGQAAAAVSNARLLAETRTRAQQLGLLYDAGLALNGVLEPHDQLAFLFGIATKALHADRAEFFKVDAQRRALTFELGVGYSEEIEGRMRGVTFPVEETPEFNGWVYRNRTPLNISDVLADPRYVQLDPDIRSGLWVPVEHEDRVGGVLSVLSTRSNAFSPQDERLLMLFANQAAVALENARLFEETQHRLAELEAVNKISSALRASENLEEMLPLFLDETLAVLDTTAGQISLFDAPSDLVRVAVARDWFTQRPATAKRGEGFRGLVMETGQAHLTREFKSDPRTDEASRSQIPSGWGGALVPLRAGREIIGVLTVSVLLPREIQPHELHLLDTLSEIAGNAIHRAGLFQKTERQVGRLAALHTIDIAISASLDLKFSLDLILEQISQGVGNRCRGRPPVQAAKPNARVWRRTRLSHRDTQVHPPSPGRGTRRTRRP